MGRASKAAAGGVTIEEQIRERVSAIPEPCAIAMGKAMTIGDMGLVEDIAFDDGHARITLCLTDAACVHFQSMQRFIADVLIDLSEVRTVEVVQTLSELWTPDRMAGG